MDPIVPSSDPFEIHKPGLVHSVLDFDAVRRYFEAHGVQDRDMYESIDSVADLLDLETRRAQFGQHFGEGVPTDLLMMALGEPGNPAASKVGGRPFWPEGKPWPTLADGEPHRFLAQFHFGDSRDLVGITPGALLVLTTEDEEAWLWEPEQLHAHWLDPDQCTPQAFDPPSTTATLPMYGVRHRAMDFPGASEWLAANYEQGAEGEKRADWCGPATVLLSTKIGGHPSFIQEDVGANLRFLAQLNSFTPNSGSAYPVIHRPEPLPKPWGDGADEYERHRTCYGDVGSLYLFLDSGGRLHFEFQCT
ncbi:MAG: DUF1963 domain-containing protein [Planctomycetota bacterium]